ncbi:hypothetical protein [Aureimonas sp. Leaf454]|uniref:hypothetical protein n=1 Tax=Aureimonas sp. Leaf454 TaxID=1736381 RepID=UPI0007017B86|nr:hypothetical protein [Aureimonas sp. Leaf454]
MRTIGWGDVNHMRDTGAALVENEIVAINGENIAKWMDDPDGRFEVRAANGNGEPASLGRFCPSL